MSKRGVNVAIVMGNVGNDPEVRYAPSGSAIANISLATTESWKDKQTGEQQERTEWHRVVFYNKLAEIVGQYVRKGSKVYIQGSIRTRKWQDQSGADRTTTEIIANDMQMLDRKGDMDGSSGFAQQQPMSAPHQKQSAQSVAEPLVSDVEDDIPF